MVFAGKFQNWITPVTVLNGHHMSPELSPEAWRMGHFLVLKLKWKPDWNDPVVSSEFQVQTEERRYLVLFIMSLYLRYEFWFITWEADIGLQVNFSRKQGCYKSAWRRMLFCCLNMPKIIRVCRICFAFQFSYCLTSPSPSLSSYPSIFSSYPVLSSWLADPFH